MGQTIPIIWAVLYLGPPTLTLVTLAMKRPRPATAFSKLLCSRVREGDLRGVLSLLSRGDAPNRSADGARPLHIAAATGSAVIVDALVRAGYPVNELGSGADRLHTPLHTAVLHSQPASAEALLRAGADALVSGEGATPLQLAMATGSVLMAELLLRWPDAEAAPLFMAAATGDAARARALIESGAALDVVRAGCTPCAVALGFGHADILRALLDAGAPVDGALLHASLGAPVECCAAVAAALSRSELDHLVGGRNALCAAVDALKTEHAIALLRAGADPNALDGDGRAAVHVFAVTAPEDAALATRFVGELLAAGADLDLFPGPAHDNRGQTTALTLAMSIGADTSVRALLEGGADLLAGPRPLHVRVAVMLRYWPILRINTVMRHIGLEIERVDATMRALETGQAPIAVACAAAAADALSEAMLSLGQTCGAREAAAVEGWLAAGRPACGGAAAAYAGAAVRVLGAAAAYWVALEATRVRAPAVQAALTAATQRMDELRRSVSVAFELQAQQPV